MKIGLQIPSFSWPGGDAVIGARLADAAERADELGFASLWVMDHFFQIGGVGEVDEPMLESYSALSFMAAHTRRARLGAMVTGVVYRHPGILVKTVTSLDVLSGGRAYLGIGAAWNERESNGLGVPFPSLKERYERLEETIEIALQMWSGKAAPFEGRHFHLAETLCRPLPLSKPHPPILIGGSGERKTLRLVAQYADACNLVGRAGEDTLRHKLDVLKRHCDALGRSYEEIEKTVLDTVDLSEGSISARQVVEKCRGLARLGFQQAIFNLHGGPGPDQIELLGREVIPEVAG